MKCFNGRRRQRFKRGQEKRTRTQRKQSSAGFWKMCETCAWNVCSVCFVSKQNLLGSDGSSFGGPNSALKVGGSIETPLVLVADAERPVRTPKIIMGDDTPNKAREKQGEKRPTTWASSLVSDQTFSTVVRSIKAHERVTLFCRRTVIYLFISAS